MQCITASISVPSVNDFQSTGNRIRATLWKARQAPSIDRLGHRPSYFARLPGGIAGSSFDGFSLD
jgi:hypothetical protein